MRMIFIILLFPFVSKAQDTDRVKVQSGIYVMVNGTDTVTIITSSTDTVYTNEILIAQSNSGSAVIKKKVKWFRPVITGSGELDWYYIDSTGTKVDVIAWKHPKNNSWITPMR